MGAVAIDPKTEIEDFELMGEVAYPAEKMGKVSIQMPESKDR